MTDNNSQKLALSESFERVAKVAKEREAFNEAMEHVIHSSTPIDFERRYAMDNLIAQDADLIDTNDKDSAVLLPCPFCGKQPWSYDDANHSTAWEVECGNTTCSAQPSVWKTTKVEAIAAWNTRQPTQSDALLDAEGVKLYWYRQGKDDGVEQERAKIVAWLRSEQISTEKLRDEMNRHTAGWHFADEHASSLEQSAAAIERGEHMQEQSK